MTVNKHNCNATVSEIKILAIISQTLVIKTIDCDTMISQRIKIH